jgi:RNA polymerase sigma factor (sigma-70 family)
MAASERSDHELIELVRSGDLAALGSLYARHHEAGLRVARAVTGETHRAEDLVSDAFERIHRAIQRGGGPDESFRAYLYTVIRRLAIEHGAASARLDDTDDFSPYEALTAVDDGTERSAEATIVASAFAALPPRHQAVLWYVDVEGMPTAEAAAFFGLSANATAALANRARAALKDAYLQAHVSGTGVAEACLPIRGKLGPYRAGSLSARDTAKVREHLEVCDECPVILAELAEVGHGLRVVIAPLVIGGAAAAAAVFGAPAPQAMAAGVPVSGRLARHQALAAAAAVAILAVGAVALALVLTPAGNDDVVAADDGAESTDVAAPSIATTPTPAASSAAPSAGPVRDPMPPTPGPRGAVPPAAPPAVVPPPTATATPAPTPTRTPTPTPTPTVPPNLAAAFVDAGDYVLGRVGVVALEIVNAGGTANATTLEVTIPSGIELDPSRPFTTSGSPDWDCISLAGAVRCTAPSVPTGATSTVYAPVVVSVDAQLGGVPTATIATIGIPEIVVTAAAQVVADGLGTRFLADGEVDVIHAGASLLSCDPAVAGCLEARRREGGWPLDNNAWAMIPIDAAALGAPSSSAIVEIPAGAAVRFAGLYWSGIVPTGADSDALGTALLASPGAAPVTVSAQQVEQQNSRYLSFLDVTGTVAAGGSGTWSFGSTAVTGGFGADAGWSLVIVLEHPALSPTRVAVFDGLQIIGIGSSASYELPSVAGGTATVGVVGWDGDATPGDTVLIDGVPLARAASGVTDNAFASFADGAVPITDGDTNTFGFDTGIFDPITTAGGRATVDLLSPAETIILGVVTLITR